MLIRRAVADDVAALSALEQRSFDGDRLSARQYRRHIMGGRNLVLVVPRAKAVVGSAVLFVRKHSKVARLYSIAVDRSMRGLGLGAALLAACERHARSLGVNRMQLEVRLDNQPGMALYESCGYERGAQIACFYEDGAAAWRYFKSL